MPNQPLPDPLARTLPKDLHERLDNCLTKIDHASLHEGEMNLGEVRRLIGTVADEGGGEGDGDMEALDALAAAWIFLRQPATALAEQAARCPSCGGPVTPPLSQGWVIYATRDGVRLV